MLELNKYSMSSSNAKTKTKKLLKEVGIKLPSDFNAKKPIPWTNSKGEQVYLDYIEIFNEMRKSGTIRKLQATIDLRDMMFCETPLAASVGLELERKVTGAGKTIYKKKLKGPASFSPVEMDLTEDILLFRERACSESHDISMVETARYFRSYMFCCIALVEAFINKYVILGLPNDKQIEDYEKQWKHTRRMEERIGLWLNNFAGSKLEQFKKKNTVAWDHFSKLRNMRNDTVHSVEIYNGYRIKKIEEGLNLVNDGVGGLLYSLRKSIGDPTAIFIERLRYAPKVKCTDGY